MGKKSTTRGYGKGEKRSYSRRRSSGSDLEASLQGVVDSMEDFNGALSVLNSRTKQHMWDSIIRFFLVVGAGIAIVLVGIFVLPSATDSINIDDTTNVSDPEVEVLAAPVERQSSDNSGLQPNEQSVDPLPAEQKTEPTPLPYNAVNPRYYWKFTWWEENLDGEIRKFAKNCPYEGWTQIDIIPSDWDSSAVLTCRAKKEDTQEGTTPLTQEKYDELIQIMGIPAHTEYKVELDGVGYLEGETEVFVWKDALNGTRDFIKAGTGRCFYLYFFFPSSPTGFDVVSCE